jgi:hypothetical protein
MTGESDATPERAALDALLHPAPERESNMSTMNQTNNPSTQNQAPAPQSPPPTPATPPLTGTAADDSNVPKVTLQAACVALVAGLRANYQPQDVFQMSIGTLTRDEVITTVLSYVNDCETTKAKKQDWRAAVQTEKEAKAAMRPVRSAVHVFFQNLLGKESAELRTYGFEPQKPRKTSVKAKAAGQALAAETRKARGTKGKKQREAITAPAATPPAPAAPAKS